MPVVENKKRNLNWGILGTGSIASIFAAALHTSPHGTLVAIGSRNPGDPRHSESFPNVRIMSYAETVLADDIDVVYIALPHTEHAAWSIRALEAGKHVLCEKPLAVNAHDAMAVIDAARRADRFLMEGFMYRMHAQFASLLQLIQRGEIGHLKHIAASFGFAAERDPSTRLFDPILGGGAIMDVGCYVSSAARMIAGAQADRHFAEPLALTAHADFGPTGVDETSTAHMSFADGLVADIECSIVSDLSNSITVTGTDGTAQLTSPWLPDLWGYSAAKLLVTTAENLTTEHTFDRELDPYVAEIDYATKSILNGRSEPSLPATSWTDSLGNMRTLDLWRKEIGVIFTAERAENRKQRFSSRLLAVAQPQTVPDTERLRLRKRASAIALGGCDIQTISHADHLYDAFFKAGGNVFDTAWIYEEADTALGEWIDNRGIREEVVVIGKGAHSPDCFPQRVAIELDQSLRKLRTSYLDIYMLHRDNPDVPVGEFVDAMDIEYRAGRVRSYGFSNWTRERLDAAIDYAQVNGRHRPSVLSNNFSLAEMAEPVWEGCVASSSGPWKSWLADNDLALLAWSSQARGFFAERTAADPLADPNFARSWETPVNLARRERARQLAERLGARTTHVALAYILAQPLPVVPIIGPLTLDELADSLKATRIALSPDDVAWLEG